HVTADNATYLFLFSNRTPPASIYTLSLHDALPIFAAGFVLLQSARIRVRPPARQLPAARWCLSPPSAPSRRREPRSVARVRATRSEEHTSELQSRENLVCRLLLEKKKTKKKNN